jgi:serine protease Do
MGVSFSIPIDVAMNVVDQIKSKGKVTRGWLGVLIQDVTRDLAESFKMDKPRGALVARVLPDSPAEDAGFQVGDIVIKFDNKEIDHSSDLPPMVGITPIGRAIPVEIIRNGEKKNLSVKIGELPAEDDIKVANNGAPGGTTDKRLGVAVADVTDEQREKSELNKSGGVFVKDVARGPAAEAGIRRGDIIMMVNNIDVKDAKQFKEIVDGLPKGKSVPVLVHRRGGPIFLAIKLGDEN